MPFIVESICSKISIASNRRHCGAQPPSEIEGKVCSLVFGMSLLRTLDRFFLFRGHSVCVCQLRSKTPLIVPGIQKKRRNREKKSRMRRKQKCRFRAVLKTVNSPPGGGGWRRKVSRP